MKSQKSKHNRQRRLTNVAWIAEEYNAVDNLTITKTKRRRQRLRTRTKTKCKQRQYIKLQRKHIKQNELGDSNYFYKGEQDDDDFEKLVLLPNEFDLKLIKRITEVNDVKVPERIQSVDTNKLNTVGADGKK